MQRLRTTSLLVFAVGFAIGCGKPVVVEFCLGADGTYQDCGIACDVTKDEASCAKFAELTKKLCDDEGKEACQAACDNSGGEKNQTACDLVAKMP
jgi:hypothetical protein